MELDSHKFIGLGRDKHQINQDPKLLWDARNIRITNRDDDTLLSITNERGTLDTTMTFEGSYVGHCELNNYVVLFTSDKDSLQSTIYRIEYVDNKLCKIILYKGIGLLSPNFPIECLGFYETELLQKVYWVDGQNQPRIINIKELELKQLKYEENKDYTEDLKYNNNSFNFCPSLKLKETIEVTKIFGQGTFLPGTIQYAFSYYKKYGQGSKIFYTTPIYYISHNDRAGAPNSPVSNTFSIKISNLDDFDYIRTYSIHRTSIDMTPRVKVVTDTELRNSKGELAEEITIVDTGTTGFDISDTDILYIGGELIKAGTIAQKDGTMFLGNLDIISNRIREVEDIIIENYNKHLFSSVEVPIQYPTVKEEKYYCYASSLNDKYSAGFKAFETYRCGIQVQFDNGEWSQPIHIGDKIINDKYLWESYPTRKEGLFEIDTSDNLINRLLELGVVKIRSCVVFPNSYERDIVCQGILSPTVFNVGDRSNNAPYAQSSWFLRPAFKENDNTQNVLNGASIQFKHYKSLFTGANRGAEVQNSITGVNSLQDIITQESVKTSRSSFFVDENIVTFHSPEVEFDITLSDLNYSDTKLRIVGIASLSSISGDIDIYASASAGDSGGLNKKYLGYTIGSENKVNGGLISGPFYEDAMIKEDYSVYGNTNYLVYPWHRQGSLNNDQNRPADKGSRTAELKTKIISNLKFFGENLEIDKVLNYNITSPQLFNSDIVSNINIDYFGNTINYYGNVDTVVLSSDGNTYSIYRSASFTDTINNIEYETNGFITGSKEPVRMKYKTSPHLVFSLKDSPNKMPILPIHKSLGNQDNQVLPIPAWDPFNDEESTYQQIDTLFIYSTGWLDSYTYSNKVGMYGIGNYNAQTNTGILAQLISTSSGVKWAAVTGSLSDSDYIILEFTSANYTSMRAESDTVLLGTQDSDYIRVGGGEGNRHYYNGDPIYYKCTFLNKGASNEIKIEVYDFHQETPSEGSAIYIKQDTFNTEEALQSPYVLIGELYRESVTNKFGGNSKEAIKSNTWLPAGDAVDIRNFIDNQYIKIPFQYGDTWYQRYDCLKTQPYTKEDPNQIVEIGSFLCETRVNIDGRYDKNRGQQSNLNISKENFNLINQVYSQKNNIFTYRILDEDFYKQSTYGTQIVWSQKKLMGGEIDLWTSISLGSYLDMDGKYGKLVKLQTYNNTLLAFQNKCLSIINFNEKTQIPVSEGLPIELSNNYKVTGYQIVQEGIGCSDKHALLETVNGLYFIDAITSTLWKYDGQLSNISDNSFLGQWFKELNLDCPWSPLKSVKNGVKLLYDSYYNDTYIVSGPLVHSEQDTLCYSNSIQSFTSYLSYGGIVAMFNLNSKTFSIKENNEGKLQLWQNFAGNYNEFFGEYKPFSISFISNNKPELYKIFDTIEYRADMYDGSSSTPLPLETFNYIRVENEYQDTTIRKNTDEVNKWNPKKKFRVWRGQIPRDAKPEAIRVRARICNPWTKITLGYDKENYNKMVFHDVIVKYTV